MSKSFSFAIGLALSATACGAAPAERSVGQTSESIIGGFEVPPSSLQAGMVVQVVRNRSDECTGTLILPDWVLTAGHCICANDAECQTWPSRPDLFVVNGRGLEWGSDVDNIILYPLFDDKSEGCVSSPCNDLALLHLKTYQELPAHPLWEQRIDSSVIHEGVVVHTYGWGSGSIPDHVPSLDELTLREAYFNVSGVANNPLQGPNPGELERFYLEPNALNQITARGDSGGPSFGAGAVLAGLTSAGDNSTFALVQAIPPSAADYIARTIAVNVPSLGDLTWGARADVNGDGVIDFCRFGTFSQPYVHLSCQLGMWNGSFNGEPAYYRPYQDEFSAGTLRAGDPRTRFMKDVNGDRAADFCRAIGSQTICNFAYLSAYGSGFGGSENIFADSGNVTFNGARVEAPGDPAIYLVDRGVRRHIPDPATFNRLFRSWDQQVVPWATTLAEGSPIAAGAHLAKGVSTPEVYFVEYNTKRHIVSPAVMDKYNFAWDKIQVFSEADMADLELGDEID